MSFIYLASPYSHINAMVMAQRYQAAREATAWLLRRRIWVYSPIVHCHDLACHHNLPRHFSFWQPYNHAMLGSAHALYILDIPGLSTSDGVNDEMKLAQKLDLPFTYMKPHTNSANNNTDYTFNPPLDKLIGVIS